MSVVRSLGIGVIGGAGLSAAMSRQYAAVDDYAEAFAAADRECLLNGMSLPPLEEPPHPELRISRLWQHAWWVTGVGVLVLVPLLAALIGALIAGASEAGSGQAFSGFMFGGFMAIVPAVVLAVVAAGVLASVGSVVKRNRRVQYDVMARIHELWVIREEARSALGRGFKPASYLEAIGIDPQYFNVGS